MSSPVSFVRVVPRASTTSTRFSARGLLRVVVPGFEVLGPGAEPTLSGTPAPLSGRLRDFTVVSDAPGFVRRLVRDATLATLLDDHRRHRVRIGASPSALSAELAVDVDASDFEGDALAAAFVDAAVRTAAGVESVASFDDDGAFDARLSLDSDDGVLAATLRQATAWLAGAIERTARGVEARLFVDDVVAGALAVHVLLSADEGAVALHLRAPVPPDLPTLHLRPARLILDTFVQRRDRKIGADDVDDAYVIEGTADVDAVLAAAQAQIVALCAHNARIDVHLATLDVRLTFARPRGPLPVAVTDAVDAALGDALALWRELRARGPRFM